MQISRPLFLVVSAVQTAVVGALLSSSLALAQSEPSSRASALEAFAQDATILKKIEEIESKGFVTSGKVQSVLLGSQCGFFECSDSYLIGQNLSTFPQVNTTTTSVLAQVLVSTTFANRIAVSPVEVSNFFTGKGKQEYLEAQNRLPWHARSLEAFNRSPLVQAEIKATKVPGQVGTETTEAILVGGQCGVAGCGMSSIVVHTWGQGIQPFTSGVMALISQDNPMSPLQIELP